MRACPTCLSVFASDPEFCAFDGTRLLPSGDTVLAGRELDGYRFDRLLGLGGTGCVFSGTVIDTGAPCAIKVLYGEMATDRSVAERFRREAEAVRAIDHPNVVKILDAGQSPAGLIYLVMERVDGPTLKEIIEREAPLAPRRAGRLAEQLVAGLAEAHHQGFVHRDLKPGNIIVTPDGPGERIKILDFGIVASLSARDHDSRLTKTGYIVGTPTYMAPEQVDPKSVSPQADVYALGVILFELLAGEPPFTGSLEQILVAKMTEAPPPLPAAQELGPLIASMLDPDPEQRPPNALHVSAALSRISLLNDDPATVRADAFVPSVETAGFPSGTVRLIDRTDPTPVLPEDEWMADTRLSPMPLDAARPAIAAVDDTGPAPAPSPTDDVPVVPHDPEEFRDDVKTTAARWDTIVHPELDPPDAFTIDDEGTLLDESPAAPAPLASGTATIARARPQIGVRPVDPLAPRVRPVDPGSELPSFRMDEPPPVVSRAAETPAPLTPPRSEEHDTDEDGVADAPPATDDDGVADTALAFDSDRVQGALDRGDTRVTPQPGPAAATPPPNPSWRWAALALLLVVSALAGFYLAVSGETVVLDVSTPPPAASP